MLNGKYIINVCFASDNWYAEHLLVAIYSLMYNLDKDFYANIYILDGWVSEDNIMKINTIKQYFHNINIDFMQITDEKYAHIDSKHLTKEAYFRIDLPYIFPSLDKILYLDCDIIVDSDISGINNYNLWDNIIWAPHDVWTYHYYHRVLWIPWESNFFNTWVLLMNLAKMREENISHKIFEYIDKNIEKIKACDQDAINAICYNKRMIIPLRYNALDRVFVWPKNRLFTQQEYDDARNNPVVIHYAWSKPWKRYCTHPLREKYHKYRNLAWLKPIQFNNAVELKLLLKNASRLLWIYLLNIIPRRYYYFLVFKPKQFLWDLL